MDSPAAAYAASRRRATFKQLTRFTGDYSFDLDPFQVQSCESLEAGNSVLVCAPTGAGKTVVGEFAVHLALSAGTKCFYTTPIKALSNQKFRDLRERHGADAVGLLTGDTSINPYAPVVVMTTEVLRNMLYVGSEALRGLGYVVLDEVHYLGDRFRGAVWEEVIIHLPESVAIAALSATVSNAEEFGAWLATVRGHTDIVVHEQRPVPLWQHMLVDHRLFDLFSDPVTATLDPELTRHVAEKNRRLWSGADDRGRGKRRTRTPYPPRHWRPPAYPEVVERLDSDGLLPMIVFIFSRAGCDAAVQACLAGGVRLADDAERDEIRRIAESRAAELAQEDLAALGYWDWLDALQRGVAAHHAGMIPAFKETVEELFTRGLVKVVFATETFALGINMPARTVVLDRLRKFNGETHADITAGEYTQLTGRAGRRGIDIEGHAVVLWNPQVDPGHVAGLASTRTYPLRSSFRPSYNMAVNLIHTMGHAAARGLLETSFAQFQADQSVVGTTRQIRKLERGRDAEAPAAVCDRGDFAEYARLRRELTELESSHARTNRASRRAAAAASVDDLSVGDVIRVPTGRRAGVAVVLDTRPAADGSPRVQVLTEDRWAGRLSLSDLTGGVASLGHLRVPKNFNHRSPQERRDLASALRELRVDVSTAERRHKRDRTMDDGDREISALRSALRNHPCHDCPDREMHARAAERASRLQREIDGQQRRVEGRTNSLSREFDRICGVLGELGYLDGAPGAEHVTAEGRVLSRVWGETDLLTAECLRAGVWDGLGPDELAAVVSSLVYEGRRDDAADPAVPRGAVETGLLATTRVYASLAETERRHGRTATREPDAGFARAAHHWSRGDSLARCLAAPRSDGDERTRRPVDTLTAGDFVRWCRQVIDLLDQIAVAAGDPGAAGAAPAPVAVTARAAADRLRRGVVSG